MLSRVFKNMTSRSPSTLQPHTMTNKGEETQRELRKYKHYVKFGIFKLRRHIELRELFGFQEACV